MSNRDYDREHFGDYFGQERRHSDESDRDFERRRPGSFDRERWRFRRSFDPESDFVREGWGGYGSEGDWEGYYGRQGGYGRGLNWGRGGDYGRGADWSPVSRGQLRRYEGYGGREEGFNRGQGYRNPEGDWGTWGGRGGREDSGWGGNWPESRFREGYDWENQRRGGYGSEFSNRGRFSGRGPKGYQRSDERIMEDISDRLSEHGDIDASDIEVQVQSGEVTLRGNVDSRYAKRLAEDLAEMVSGVKDIRNELKVQQGMRTGEERAA